MMIINCVERNAKISFGQPIIAGRRLTVFSVVTSAHIAASIFEFLKDFSLSYEQLMSAIHYCKNKNCHKMDLVTDKYCAGCILRSISDGWKSIKDDFYETDGFSIAFDRKSAALMSLNEFEESEFGILGWVLAEEVEKRILNG